MELVGIYRFGNSLDNLQFLLIFFFYILIVSINFQNTPLLNTLLAAKIKLLILMNIVQNNINNT